eukprot:Nk52_evm8s1129 gene=Nk52_evmTU8s1129
MREELAKRVPIGDGRYTMPTLSFATSQSSEKSSAEMVSSALLYGYQHIECASINGNEADIGKFALKPALDSGIIKRNDLFVTSKLWNTFHKYHDVIQACKQTLRDLHLDYLDLYLMHWPVALAPDSVPPWRNPNGLLQSANVTLSETWRAMEFLLEDGYVRNIGVCNFTTRKLDVISRNGKIRPAVCQVEMHPYCPQNTLLEYCSRNKIHVIAQTPLACGLPPSSLSPPLLENPIILKIAKLKKKTPSQVVLRWNIQRGVSVATKSSSLVSLNNALSVYDFNLSDLQFDEISRIIRYSHRFVDGKLFLQKNQSMEDFWDEHPNGE